jgi:prepilin-type N-terminal cleavage/methylation domain-containing protein
MEASFYLKSVFLPSSKEARKDLLTKRNISATDVSGTDTAHFPRMKTTFGARHSAFTLVEIMIVVAIIALLAAIAVPGFLRARKRSQASRIINDLRLIDSAVDQYAIETNRASGFSVGTADWTNYLKKDTNLYLTGKDILGNSFGEQMVDSLPRVPSATYNTLSDVTDATFWSPYN